MLRLMIVLAVLAAGPASAGLKFCNKTANKAIVAIGYIDGGVWTSEGWWHVAEQGCQTVVGKDLSKKFYYYRAKSDVNVWGDQKYFFCTSSDEFTIAGDADCGDRGFERAEFNQIEVGSNTSFTMNLTAGAPAKKQPAPVAKPRASQPAPGTYGEPYSISGLFSHCEVFDVTMACEIHANGFRYVANSADPTAQSLLERLMALPVNTPLSISGDMMFYEGNVAQVTIREYDIAGIDPYGPQRYRMQGYFTSIDDSAYQLIIYGNTFAEMYDGNPSDTSMMEFANGCPGFPGDGPAINFKSFANPDEDRCMFLTLDGDFIELFPAGGMGELIFLKEN